MPPGHIAILGGGITGLSAAFHLSLRYHQSLVTVFEKQGRFGGWVRSERVNVSDPATGRSASVVLEAGPRTLRPNSKAVLELIHLLGLAPSLVTVPKTAPAAQNRFLYLQPSVGSPLSGLHALPSSLLGLLTSPIARKLLLPALLREPFRRKNRPSGELADSDFDESFDGLLRRRFGPQMADTFGSALVHGIYAGDSRQLSVRAAFPSMWEMEDAGGGSMVRGGLWRAIWPKKPEGDDASAFELGDLPQRMKNVSVFTFEDGIGQLTSAMHTTLRERKNVRLVSETPVSDLRYDNISNTFPMPSGPPATHVVAALPLPHLMRLLPAQLPALSSLASSPASSVSVTAFVFPPTPTPLHPPGFGYLVPRPAPGGLLGAVFDGSTEGFTRITAMLHTPTPTSAVLARLAEQLGRGPLPEPVAVREWKHRECIPLPAVGHLGRVARMREEITRAFDGRMEVVGAGVGGVSVGDCVRQGREAGVGWS